MKAHLASLVRDLKWGQARVLDFLLKHILA